MRGTTNHVVKNKIESFATLYETANIDDIKKEMYEHFKEGFKTLKEGQPSDDTELDFDNRNRCTKVRMDNMTKQWKRASDNDYYEFNSFDELSFVESCRLDLHFVILGINSFEDYAKTFLI